MEDITHDFGTLYHPIAALVFYKSKGNGENTYVEHFDMDKDGRPINAHPLTTKEAKALALALNTKTQQCKAFLKSDGILPTNILSINPSDEGSVTWFTKAKKVNLYFSTSLEIPNGIANVPAMLWLASREKLQVFAVDSNKRPSKKTVLYHAPFFNVYEDGFVCMGTVNVDIKQSTSTEEFVNVWQNYFFHSYFSHLVPDHNPIHGNCVTLWKNLIDTDTPFPITVLKKTELTLNDLLL